MEAKIKDKTARFVQPDHELRHPQNTPMASITVKLLTLSQATNFGSSEPKEFADDNH